MPDLVRYHLGALQRESDRSIVHRTSVNGRQVRYQPPNRTLLLSMRSGTLLEPLGAFERPGAAPNVARLSRHG